MSQFTVHEDPEPSVSKSSQASQDSHEEIKIDETREAEPAPKKLEIPMTMKLEKVPKKNIFRWFEATYRRHQFEYDTAVEVFMFLFDVYKITVGSFLLAFTYQQCDILQEKFTCFSQPYTIFALSWNVLTFICCFVLLGFQIHRESYFIRELCEFPRSPEYLCVQRISEISVTSKSKFREIGSIEDLFLQYPNTSREDIFGRDILESITWFNAKYGLALRISAAVYICNVFFSGASLLAYSYMGSKTVTSFASNVLLLGLLIAKGIYIVSRTENSEKIIACSARKQDYILYNGVNIHTRWRKMHNEMSCGDDGIN